ncbi:hypothetical protein [Arthrobacter sp. 2MCAF14]|uniref:hypothetical protein n=1 Tax=Arthrobacter sp. 2MCAF14 TaxID=3232982 RepID=UPI003F9211A1
MSTEAILTTGYHRPDTAVKLAILKGRHGYTEARAAALYGKNMTLALIREGEMLVAEGTLRPGLAGYARFVPKGCRTVSETWDVAGIIGHTNGYGNAVVITSNALREFDGITTDDVLGYLAARELEAREITNGQAAAAIARSCREVQTNQADDARILASFDVAAPALALALAA